LLDVAEPGLSASTGQIRRITLASGAVATMSLSGAGSALNFPGSVAVDTAGNIYVADTANHQIKMYNSSGAIQKIYGLGTSGSVDGIASGGGAVAKFNNPNGVAVNGAGTFIYVADTSGSIIRRIDVSGNSVATIGGTIGSAGWVEGAPSTSRYDRPYALALDSGGTNLYVADMGNNAVRRIALNVLAASCVTSTVAGVGGSPASPGSADGNSTDARFRSPYGIAVDSSGSLYVADTANNTIRKITTPNTSPAVTTIAGSAGSAGISDGIGSAARFQSPWGIAVTSAGTLYIADSNNQTIRSGSAATAPAVTSQPVNATWTIGTSSSVTFTVAASGSPTPTVQWQRQPAAGGGYSNLTNSGLTAG
jgi:DNA-binding beta-propeller fold protein YncE